MYRGKRGKGRHKPLFLLSEGANCGSTVWRKERMKLVKGAWEAGRSADF